MNLVNLKWSIPRRFLATALMSVLMLSLSAQQGQEVTGLVKDAASGQPVAGVSIQIKGTTSGAITDGRGAFAVRVAAGNTLTVSCIGYLTQEIAVGGQTHIVISLSESAVNMEAVVKIGYGTSTKKEITGAITTIREEDLNRGTFTNAAGLLQGKVAGLNIVNPRGGDPNAQYEMVLRGTNSLTSGSNPLVIVDGVAGVDMRNVNFQDVESFDVLKDGSAAAIYGTRGTNGVIIITTKRARSGVTQVEYDGQLNLQAVTRRATSMTAGEFEYAVRHYSPGNVDKLYGFDTDWFDLITRTPVSHKHTLTISGGSELFSHRTMLNIEQNQGIQKKNDSDKYMFRTNIRQKALKGWLDLDYNAFMNKRKYTPSNDGAFRQAFLRNPTEPVYGAGDERYGGYYPNYAMDYYNPVAMIDERDALREADNIGLSARATLNILPIKGLKWDNMLSFGQESYEGRTYYTKYYPSMLGSGGVASIEHSKDSDYQWESTLNYAGAIGLHRLQALLGYTWEKAFSDGSGMTNTQFDSDVWGTDNIGAGAGWKQGDPTAGINSGKSSHTYIGFFGRAMYNYDERYLASVSVRRDGSSRFGQDQKWGWFPAVSVGWRISREQFMREVRWVDELKLRAGYGVTGNQNFDNYMSLVLFQSKNYWYSDGQWYQGYTPLSNSNPKLRWERKSEWNAGVDFALLKNRLSGSIDYYRRDAKDLLYQYPVSVPPYLVETMWANVATIRNSGVEVALTGIPVQGKEFRWSSTLTFARNANKLVKFANDEFRSANAYPSGSWLPTPMGAYCQRITEGESLGSFYAPVWEGVGADGKDILRGAVAGSVAESKWERAGSAYPDFTLGWSNALTYKKWDLNATMRASIGGKVFNSYRGNYENINFIGQKNILASWLDTPSFTGNAVYSSKYIEDATYFKIDNLQLGYTFAFVPEAMVKKLRLSFSAQNFLTLTGYKGVDPEVALAGLAPGIEEMSYYPRTAVFTFGVNMTF
ncbi:SusC/RagA family TonB-linked outer membrane protein [Bacteroidia bacterium]|nr:SusC/RagA family TonB-linked outer membrane protein [Bacteroidia bacterium]